MRLTAGKNWLSETTRQVIRVKDHWVLGNMSMLVMTHILYNPPSFFYVINESTACAGNDKCLLYNSIHYGYLPAKAMSGGKKLYPLNREGYAMIHLDFNCRC